MAKCKKCGKTLDEGAKFCPSCGTAVSGKSVKTETQKLQQADALDAENNKGMAVVAYLLFFIPLITGDHKKSPFVMFHTNQGTILFIFSVGGWIVSSILMVILIGILLGTVVGITSLVFLIIGIINAVQGRMKPLPVIGKFEIIK
jgi:uncharacterized membrane protein